jgi:hypothetical protein
MFYIDQGGGKRRMVKSDRLSLVQPSGVLASC